MCLFLYFLIFENMHHGHGSVIGISFVMGLFLAFVLFLYRSYKGVRETLVGYGIINVNPPSGWVG